MSINPNYESLSIVFLLFAYIKGRRFPWAMQQINDI